MMYRIVNKELGIASCSLAELTIKQVQRFLGQWEPGSNIGSLILFYDEKADMIVLNSSNKKYDAFLYICFIGIYPLFIKSYFSYIYHSPRSK